MVTNTEALANVSCLFHMENEELEHTLTRRVLASKKEQVYSKLPPSRAKYSRDALAKVCPVYIENRIGLQSSLHVARPLAE